MSGNVSQLSVDSDLTNHTHQALNDILKTVQEAAVINIDLLLLKPFLKIKKIGDLHKEWHKNLLKLIQNYQVA